MSIFANIDLTTLDIGSEEQLISLLTSVQNAQIVQKGIQTYHTKIEDSNGILINYYLPSGSIILCDISKVTATTNNLTQQTIGYQVTTTGFVQLLLIEETPITIA